MAFTPEQVAQRILELLDQRHTKSGEHDMFGAIAARLADEDIYGESLNSGVVFGTEQGWFRLRGPKILRTDAVSAPKA